MESFKKFSFLSPMRKFLFIANDPCLDFVNTEVVLVGARTDLLQSFADLTAWFEQANLPSMPEVHRLAKVWGDHRAAKVAFQAARVLRNVLRSSVERVVSAGTVPNNLADILKDELQHARLATDVVHSLGRLKTKPHWILEQPQDLLVVVAHYAANFFAMADYSAVRKCENPECILYFYDTSKNHARRWCSMSLCGNRAKVAAFRDRLIART